MWVIKVGNKYLAKDHTLVDTCDNLRLFDTVNEATDIINLFLRIDADENVDNVIWRNVSTSVYEKEFVDTYFVSQYGEIRGPFVLSKSEITAAHCLTEKQAKKKANKFIQKKIKEKLLEVKHLKASLHKVKR